MYRSVEKQLCYCLFYRERLSEPNRPNGGKVSESSLTSIDSNFEPMFVSSPSANKNARNLLRSPRKRAPEKDVFGRYRRNREIPSTSGQRSSLRHREKTPIRKDAPSVTHRPETKHQTVKCRIETDTLSEEDPLPCERVHSDTVFSRREREKINTTKKEVLKSKEQKKHEIPESFDLKVDGDIVKHESKDDNVENSQESRDTKSKSSERREHRHLDKRDSPGRKENRDKLDRKVSEERKHHSLKRDVRSGRKSREKERRRSDENTRTVDKKKERSDSAKRTVIVNDKHPQSNDRNVRNEMKDRKHEKDREHEKDRFHDKDRAHEKDRTYEKDRHIDKQEIKVKESTRNDRFDRKEKDTDKIDEHRKHTEKVADRHSSNKHVVGINISTEDKRKNKRNSETICLQSPKSSIKTKEHDLNEGTQTGKCFDLRKKLRQRQLASKDANLITVSEKQSERIKTSVKFRKKPENIKLENIKDVTEVLRRSPRKHASRETTSKKLGEEMAFLNQLKSTVAKEKSVATKTKHVSNGETNNLQLSGGQTNKLIKDSDKSGACDRTTSRPVITYSDYKITDIASDNDLPLAKTNLLSKFSFDESSNTNINSVDMRENDNGFPGEKNLEVTSDKIESQSTSGGINLNFSDTIEQRHFKSVTEDSNEDNPKDKTDAHSIETKQPESNEDIDVDTDSRDSATLRRSARLDKKRVSSESDMNFDKEASAQPTDKQTDDKVEDITTDAKSPECRKRPVLCRVVSETILAVTSIEKSDSVTYTVETNDKDVDSVTYTVDNESDDRECASPIESQTGKHVCHKSNCRIKISHLHPKSPMKTALRSKCNDKSSTNLGGPVDSESIEAEPDNTDNRLEKEAAHQLSKESMILDNTETSTFNEIENNSEQCDNQSKETKMLNIPKANSEEIDKVVEKTGKNDMRVSDTVVESSVATNDLDNKTDGEVNHNGESVDITTEKQKDDKTKDLSPNEGECPIEDKAIELSDADSDESCSVSSKSGSESGSGDSSSSDDSDCDYSEDSSSDTNMSPDTESDAKDLETGNTDNPEKNNGKLETNLIRDDKLLTEVVNDCVTEQNSLSKVLIKELVIESNTGKGKHNFNEKENLVENTESVGKIVTIDNVFENNSVIEKRNSEQDYVTKSDDILLNQKEDSDKIMTTAAWVYNSVNDSKGMVTIQEKENSSPKSQPSNASLLDPTKSVQSPKDNISGQPNKTGRSPMLNRLLTVVQMEMEQKSFPPKLPACVNQDKSDLLCHSTVEMNVQGMGESGDQSEPLTEKEVCDDKALTNNKGAIGVSDTIHLDTMQTDQIDASTCPEQVTENTTKPDSGLQNSNFDDLEVSSDSSSEYSGSSASSRSSRSSSGSHSCSTCSSHSHSWSRSSSSSSSRSFSSSSRSSTGLSYSSGSYSSCSDSDSDSEDDTKKIKTASKLESSETDIIGNDTNVNVTSKGRDTEDLPQKVLTHEQPNPHVKEKEKSSDIDNGDTYEKNFPNREGTPETETPVLVVENKDEKQVCVKVIMTPTKVIMTPTKRDIRSDTSNVPRNCIVINPYVVEDEAFHDNSNAKLEKNKSLLEPKPMETDTVPTQEEKPKQGTEDNVSPRVFHSEKNKSLLELLKPEPNETETKLIKHDISRPAKDVNAVKGISSKSPRKQKGHIKQSNPKCNVPYANTNSEQSNYKSVPTKVRNVSVKSVNRKNNINKTQDFSQFEESSKEGVSPNIISDGPKNCDIENTNIKAYKIDTLKIVISKDSIKHSLDKESKAIDVITKINKDDAAAPLRRSPRISKAKTSKKTAKPSLKLQITDNYEEEEDHIEVSSEKQGIEQNKIEKSDDNKEDNPKLRNHPRKKLQDKDSRKKPKDAESIKKLQESESRKKLQEDESRKKLQNAESRKKFQESESRKKLQEDESRKKHQNAESRKKFQEVESRKKLQEEGSRKKLQDSRIKLQSKDYSKITPKESNEPVAYHSKGKISVYDKGHFRDTSKELSNKIMKLKADQMVLKNMLQKTEMANTKTLSAQSKLFDEPSNSLPANHTDTADSASDVDNASKYKTTSLTTRSAALKKFTIPKVRKSSDKKAESHSRKSKHHEKEIDDTEERHGNSYERKDRADQRARRRSDEQVVSKHSHTPTRNRGKLDSNETVESKSTISDHSDSSDVDALVKAIFGSTDSSGNSKSADGKDDTKKKKNDETSDQEIIEPKAKKQKIDKLADILFVDNKEIESHDSKRKTETTKESKPIAKAKTRDADRGEEEKVINVKTPTSENHRKEENCKKSDIEEQVKIERFHTDDNAMDCFFPKVNKPKANNESTRLKVASKENSVFGKPRQKKRDVLPELSFDENSMDRVDYHDDIGLDANLGGKELSEDNSSDMNSELDDGSESDESLRNTVKSNNSRNKIVSDSTEDGEVSSEPDAEDDEHAENALTTDNKQPTGIPKLKISPIKFLKKLHGRTESESMDEADAYDGGKHIRLMTKRKERNPSESDTSCDSYTLRKSRQSRQDSRYADKDHKFHENLKRSPRRLDRSRRHSRSLSCSPNRRHKAKSKSPLKSNGRSRSKNPKHSNLSPRKHRLDRNRLTEQDKSMSNSYSKHSRHSSGNRPDVSNERRRHRPLSRERRLSKSACSDSDKGYTRHRKSRDCDISKRDRNISKNLSYRSVCSSSDTEDLGRKKTPRNRSIDKHRDKRDKLNDSYKDSRKRLRSEERCETNRLHSKRSRR